MNKLLFRMKKSILMGLLAIVLLCSYNTVTYASEQVVTESELQSVGGISTYSAIIEYRYKFENGHLYRRLYNYTEQCWAQDYWEFVQ